MLPTILFLATLTGFLCELLRYIVLPTLAYPVYLVHLFAVFVFLALLPHSKLAHAAYYVVASVRRRYTTRRAPVGEPSLSSLQPSSIGPLRSDLSAETS